MEKHKKTNGLSSSAVFIDEAVSSGDYSVESIIEVDIEGKWAPVHSSSSLLISGPPSSKLDPLLYKRFMVTGSLDKESTDKLRTLFLTKETELIQKELVRLERVRDIIIGGGFICSFDKSSSQFVRFIDSCEEYIKEYHQQFDTKIHIICNKGGYILDNICFKPTKYRIHRE